MIYNTTYRDGFNLFNRWSARDPEARAEVGALFPLGSECFACAQPVGTEPGLWCCEDPTRPRTGAVLGSLCAECMALPPIYRAAKVAKMMRAMWGDRVGHNVRMVPPRVLRAAAGGR